MPQFSLSETQGTLQNTQTEVEFSKQPQQYPGDPMESMLCKLRNDANYPVSLLYSLVTLIIEPRSALSPREVFPNSLTALRGFNERQISPRISRTSLCAPGRAPWTRNFFLKPQTINISLDVFAAGDHASSWHRSSLEVDIDLQMLPLHWRYSISLLRFDQKALSWFSSARLSLSLSPSGARVAGCWTQGRYQLIIWSRPAIYSRLGESPVSCRSLFHKISLDSSTYWTFLISLMTLPCATGNRCGGIFT